MPTAFMVVENGAIVESGRHDELLRKSGRYAAFYRLQLKDEQEPTPPIADWRGRSRHGRRLSACL